MARECGTNLRIQVVEEIENRAPAITLDELIESLDADPDEVIRVVEELQHYGDIDQQIIIWRGGHSSKSVS